jgi:hypothetical protein
MSSPCTNPHDDGCRNMIRSSLRKAKRHLDIAVESLSAEHPLKNDFKKAQSRVNAAHAAFEKLHSLLDSQSGK